MLQDDIKNDLKASMKAKDAVRTGALRMVIAALKDRQIELRRELEPGDALAVVQSQVKRRRDSVEQFEKAGRDDLVQKESREIEILEAYLPKGLTPEELDAAVDAAIAETGAASKKDMGKVMKAIMAKFRGQVDGKAVNQIVAKKLS